MEVKPDSKYQAVSPSGALAQLNNELRVYWPAIVTVAKGYSFNMEETINRARRNYFGIFEEPKDPVSGQDKTWVPLTEATVETIVKTVDIDTKDIQILPRRPEDLLGAKILRPIAKFLLDKLDFGQVLNDLIRAMVTDGTVVLKTFKGLSRDQKKKVTKAKIVDLLNFYIDPSADYSQDSHSTIERVIMYASDLKKYPEWKNTEIGGGKVDRTPSTAVSGDDGTKEVAVFERWGRICKAWLVEFKGETASDEDSKEWFEGVVIASGSSGNSTSSMSATTLHYVGENKHPKKLRPYEEGWYRRVMNRWHGRGVPEQLFGLQEYVNQVVNIRKNNANILQNGLFLIRKGSGITPKMISSLGAGGGIPVTGLDTDIKQLPVQDVRESSYKDEQVASSWAKAVSMGLNTPNEVAPSAPATLGIINQQNTRDVFDLIQEGIGLMLKRLLQNHLLPSFLDELEVGELIRITGDTRDIEDLDQIYIETRVNEAALAYLEKTGFWPSEEERMAESERLQKELKKLGSHRFIEYKKSFFDFDYDLEVIITQESLNKSVIAQQLRDMVISYSRVPGINIDIEKVFQEWMYILGLNADIYKPNKQQMSPEQRIGQPSAGPRPVQELPVNPTSPAQEFSNSQGLPNAGMQR